MLPNTPAVSIPAHQQPPLACEAGQFTPQDRARQQALLQQFRKSIVQTKEEADRVQVRVDLDRMPLADLGAWIGYERRCCPFLTFDLHLEPGSSFALITLGNGPDIKNAATAELLGR